MDRLETKWRAADRKATSAKEAAERDEKLVATADEVAATARARKALAEADVQKINALLRSPPSRADAEELLETFKDVPALLENRMACATFLVACSKHKELVAPPTDSLAMIAADKRAFDAAARAARSAKTHLLFDECLSAARRAVFGAVIPRTVAALQKALADEASERKVLTAAVAAREIAAGKIEQQALDLYRDAAEAGAGGDSAIAGTLVLQQPTRGQSADAPMQDAADAPMPDVTDAPMPAIDAVVERVNAAENDLAVLGVTSTATMADIKRARKKLCLSLHPDKAGDASGAKEALERVNGAYEALAKRHGRKSHVLARLLEPVMKALDLNDKLNLNEKLAVDSNSKIRLEDEILESPDVAAALMLAEAIDNAMTVLDVNDDGILGVVCVGETSLELMVPAEIVEGKYHTVPRPRGPMKQGGYLSRQCNAGGPPKKVREYYQEWSAENKFVMPKLALAWINHKLSNLS